MTDVVALDARRDPLAETLFRPTVVPDVAPGPQPLAVRPEPPAAQPEPPAAQPAPGPAPADGSAAPRRAAGTRVRAGNAMGRTRQALLDGAARAVAADGTAITMAQVASLGGVAKATLYNHFRTREAVLEALLAAEVDTLATRLRGLSLRHALVEAAAAVVTHPALATLRTREPATVAAALTAAEPPTGLLAARQALQGLVSAAGLGPEVAPQAADLALRWLVTLALAPADPADVLDGVDLLLAGLLA